MARHHVMGDGTVITDCGSCACPTSSGTHNEAVDEEGRKYCAVCHQWL